MQGGAWWVEGGLVGGGGHGGVQTKVATELWCLFPDFILKVLWVWTEEFSPTKGGFVATWPCIGEQVKRDAKFTLLMCDPPSEALGVHRTPSAGD